jgi:hypothetical protein
MLHGNRAWRPIRAVAGIVHHATPLTKKEAEYLFRLADTVRAVVECGECGAKVGAECVRKKDKQPMANHSYRVRQARLLFEQRVLPKLDRLHQTLCTAGSGPGHVVFNQADDPDVDCMSCLVVIAKQQG